MNRTQVIAYTGSTDRQLQNWTETSLLRLPAPVKHKREWPTTELLFARAAVLLGTKGVTLFVIRRIADQVRPQLRMVALLDGREPFYVAATSERVLVTLLPDRIAEWSAQQMEPVAVVVVEWPKN